MINMALYKREMKGSIKLLIVFSAIITMYVTIIINMYDPQMMKTLDSFVEVMPEVMSAVGMKANAANLLEGVNNFVSLDFSSGRISTHPKHLRIQCLQGSVGSAHTRPLE